MITIAQDPLFDEAAVSSRIQNLWMQLQAAHIDEDLNLPWSAECFYCPPR